MAVVDRKSIFRRALIALRYAVAAAVTVVIIMTAVYAFVVVARSDDPSISVVGSYISVDDQSRKLSFTLSVDNPSGRVRFYYTGIHCVLKVNDSRKEPSTEKFDFPDIVVAPDSLLQIGTEANLTTNSTRSRLIPEFKYNRSSQFDANLTLNGSLTVGVYSVYNKTSVPTTYHCTSVVVGNVSGSSEIDSSVCSIVTNEELSGRELWS